MKLAQLTARLIVLGVIVSGFSIFVGAQITEFTYQGRLTEASAPASGTYDFQFAVYDASTGGFQQPQPSPITVARTSVQVSNGVFAVQLNFGAAAFPGADRYLEIRVKKPNDAGYVPLAPRQPLVSVPYAIRSLNADFATNAANAATAANAAQLGGAAASNYAKTNSTAFVRNQTDQQTGDFNISGTGQANIFDAAMQYNISGSRVLSITGANNLFAGVNTGAFNTTGINNSFFGINAGFLNTNGNSNSFIGYAAGIANSVGSFNSFVGYSAGFGNTTGDLNLFVGYDAGYLNTTGSENSFVGASAGYFNRTGRGNSFVGAGAGSANTAGSNNTLVGSSANVGANNLMFAAALGSNAVVNANDTIVIGKVAGTYNGSARPADTVLIPGNLNVTGTLTKGGGAFKIDHPLDPQNKYLSHSFVESPDMKNIYDGNVTTDASGEATVVLPDYFEALNRDFRYQLTAIGQFAQAIVAQKIKGNQFKIRTDKPNVEVSWQVTGIRQDKFAEENRIPNTENKPAAERGRCLYERACQPK